MGSAKENISGIRRIFRSLVRKILPKKPKDHASTTEIRELAMVDGSTYTFPENYGKSDFLVEIFNKLVLVEPRPADLLKLWKMFDVYFRDSQDDHEPNMVEAEVEIEIVPEAEIQTELETETQIRPEIEPEDEILTETKTKYRRLRWICCINP